MSVAKIKEAAEATKETYVIVSAADLAEALKDSEEHAALVEHCKDRLKRNPHARVGVHREIHLGKLLGVPALPLES